MTVGSGRHTYRGVAGWPQLPGDAIVRDGVGAGVTSDGRVVIFVRGTIPVLIFDADGTFLSGWGAGRFSRPHGMLVLPDDTLILVDDKAHTVERFTLDGERVGAIGPSGIKAESGIVDNDYRTIRAGIGPYNQPTNVARTSDGRIFVSDGYANARVHRFSPDGELERSWGRPGRGDGEFNVPHGIAAGADDRLFVCDRENSRVQVFSSDGDLLAIWSDVVRPCHAAVGHDGAIVVVELGLRAGIYPFDEGDPDGQGGRISIFDPDGVVLARWGTGQDPTAAEDLYAPHGVAIGGDGSIYTTEVVVSAGSRSGDAAHAFPAIRKFEAVSEAT